VCAAAGVARMPECLNPVPRLAMQAGSAIAGALPRRNPVITRGTQLLSTSLRKPRAPRVHRARVDGYATYVSAAALRLSPGGSRGIGAVVALALLLLPRRFGRAYSRADNPDAVTSLHVISREPAPGLALTRDIREIFPIHCPGGPGRSREDRRRGGGGGGWN